jgi:hypothetical protein
MDLNKDRDFGDEDQLDLDDPLGIARQPVSPDSNIRASSDEDSVRRRRKRAGLDEFQDRSDGLGDLNRDPQGAKSIDMGGGGDGNQIKSSRE